MNHKFFPHHSKSPKNHQDYLLALDLGSHTVKAVIAKNDKKPCIIGIGHADRLIYNQDTKQFTPTSFLAAAEKAIYAAEQQSGIVSRYVSVGLSKEIIKGATSTIHYERQNPKTPVSFAEIEAVIKKLQDHAKAAATTAIALESHLPNSQAKLINSSVLGFAIDGKKVKNPLKVKGRELSIELFTAFAPHFQITAIEKLCLELKLELLAISSAPFALSRALHLKPETFPDQILVDIGYETTSLALIQNGLIRAAKTFSLGAKQFWPQHSPVFDPFSFSKTNFSPANANQDIPTPHFDLWLSGLEIALSDFSSLPFDLVLSGAVADLPELQETLAVSDWYQSLAFSRRPTIHLFDPKNLTEFKLATADPLDASDAVALGLIKIATETINSTPNPSPLDRLLSL